MTFVHAYDTSRVSAMAPETNGSDGNGGSSAMDAAPNKKPRKRKKSRSSSSSAVRSATSSSSLPTDGDGGGGGQQRQPAVVVVQQQQQLHRGKQRVVWTPELHDVFLKACDVLGKDAVPKKILALMNVDGISREHVASHLQKHRLNLKREQQQQLLQRVPGRGAERQPIHAESSSQTPLPSLHPPEQAPAASSSLHPLPTPQPPFASLTMSQLQLGHGHHELLQTPPADCFTSSNVPTNFLVHPHPGGFPMVVQPIQQCFTPPLQATIAVLPKKLVKKPQAGHNNATMQQAAAVASGYNPMLLIRSNVPQTLAGALQMQAPQVVSMTGEISVPEANLMIDQETEICSVAHLLMTVEAEEGQGRPAQREAASEMTATTVEEGQGRPAQREAASEMTATTVEKGQEQAAAEPGAAETAAKAEEGQGRDAEPGGGAAAAAVSLNLAGSSIHEQFWKTDDPEGSWDFCGFAQWYKSD
ncbi:unnamed protein product [Urochloa decumbens]|uniref:HTH myb-type domain-containing protein n=1 Tax=Urochloa decumbens TaxID=240449 RepID=A0ABC8Z144_9POAL